MSPPLRDPLYVESNPQCKHDRSSFTIVNCDACIAYTENMLKLRAEAAAAESAVPSATKPSAPAQK